MDIHALTARVIGCAYNVHNGLGAGFLEKVYENAMCLELDRSGVSARQQAPIRVKYRGQAVGDFAADLLIEDRLVVELKAVQQITKEHEVQLVNYLAATGIDDGLLINFGSSVQVRRKYGTYRARRPQSPGF